ncbi:MAG: hypothetical protein ACI3XR_01230 [Eubacteriales bacterium]
MKINIRVMNTAYNCLHPILGAATCRRLSINDNIRTPSSCHEYRLRLPTPDVWERQLAAV